MNRKSTDAICAFLRNKDRVMSFLFTGKYIEVSFPQVKVRLCFDKNFPLCENFLPKTLTWATLQWEGPHK